MIRKLTSWAVVAVLFLAVWRINNGDLTHFADGIWGILNQGADIVIQLWNSLQHMNSQLHTVSSAAANTTAAVA